MRARFDSSQCMKTVAREPILVSFFARDELEEFFHIEEHYAGNMPLNHFFRVFRWDFSHFSQVSIRMWFNRTKTETNRKRNRDWNRNRVLDASVARDENAKIRLKHNSQPFQTLHEEVLTRDLMRCVCFGFSRNFLKEKKENLGCARATVECHHRCARCEATEDCFRWRFAQSILRCCAFPAEKPLKSISFRMTTGNGTCASCDGRPNEPIDN